MDEESREFNIAQACQTSGQVQSVFPLILTEVSKGVDPCTRPVGIPRPARPVASLLIARPRGVVWY